MSTSVYLAIHRIIWMLTICMHLPPLDDNYQFLQFNIHYNDAILNVMASQVTSLTIVYSTVYSGTDQRKHQRSASLAFVWGIHRWPVNSPHKGPVTRKMFPFDDVIMCPSSFSSMYLLQIGRYPGPWKIYCQIRAWSTTTLNQTLHSSTYTMRPGRV